MRTVTQLVKLKFASVMTVFSVVLLVSAICQPSVNAAEPKPREVLEQYAKSHQNGLNFCCNNNGYCAVLEPGASAEELEQYLRGSIQVGSRYNTVGNRFSSTALTPNTSRGDPIVITYSFVRDGVTVASSPYQSAGPNNLNTTLNSQFGSTSTWKGVFRQFFTRWEQVSGVRFQEVSDDGAAWGSNGQAGVRGDMRIWGIAIPGGVAAYTYYPGSGSGCDMVVDTSLNWADSSNNYRFMRDALGHETGHGLGLGHCTSSTSHFLMEPYVDTTIDGPQDDDIRGVQRQYGDTYERRGSSGTGHNNSLSTATDFGTLSGNNTYYDASIDDGADIDYYKFNIGGSSSVTVTVKPQGGSYSIGNQGGSESTIDSSRIQDLRFDILNSSGGTITSVNSTGLGGTESATVNLSAGTYYVRVDDVNGASDVQLYTLSINVGGAVASSPTLTSISVSPSSATITTGQTQQFTATAKDQNGNTMSASFSWSVSGGGSISSSGLFSANTAGGPYTVTASSSGKSGTAQVTVNAQVVSSSLPSPWQDRDIGSTGSGGSASASNGTFSVRGSGSDIWNTSDSFNYVYQPLNGDGTIVARVDSMQNTNAWAKAGVMIRESLNADSKHALVAATPSNGIVFQRRNATSGTSTNTTGPYATAPRWVKLSRSGSTLTASQSADGSNWSQIGTDTISMNSSVYVGLALTAHSYGTINSTSFSNVSVTTGGTSSSGGGTGSITPSLIQAEDYRTGGEGVGYHDTTAGNSGGGYRSDNVDIEPCGDSGGGYDVCYIAAGEWLTYNINASASGTFNFSLRMASWADNNTVHLEIDGARVGTTIAVPRTSGSQSYINATATNISVGAGSHVLKVVFDTGNMNFNYLTISSSSAINLGDNANPVIGSCSATPEDAAAGQTVAFTANATDADNDALTYTWDFGDGTIDTGMTTAHAYAAAGLYIVTLTVDDSRGGTANQTLNIMVGEQAAPQGDLKISRLRAGLNLATPGNDLLRLNGSCVIPSDVQTADMPLTIDCGGAEVHFVLDSKGAAQFRNGTVRISRKKGSSESQISVSLKKQSLAEMLSANLPEGDVSKVQLPINVEVTIGNTVYTAIYNGNYSSKKGKVAKIY